MAKTRITLGEAFKTVTGNTPSKSNGAFFGQFMPLVKPPELRDSTVESAEDGLSELGSTEARVAPPNSILVSCIGNLGKIGLNTVPVAFNQQINAILPESKHAIPQFMFYQVLGPDFKAQLETLASGTTVPIVNKSRFNSIEIVLPPLPEQRRIVGILDEAFAGIATAKANAEKNLQNARALFESHLHAVFTHRSPGWVETRLDHISTNLDSKRVPITKSDRKAGEYPYYGASGIVDYVADYIFEGDTLLVSEDGANLLARSSPIAFSASGKYWVNNHAHILKFDHMATQRFVEFYLESIKLDEFITGAAQPKLNQKALNSIPIPIPKTVEEQSAITARLDALQTETRRLEALNARKLAALDELKASLLHQAFSGHL